MVLCSCCEKIPSSLYCVSWVSFHQHAERQQGPDRHQVEGKQVGLTERQRFEKLVRLVDRIHIHQEDDPHFLVTQPELLHFAVEIQLQCRRDFLRQITLSLFRRKRLQCADCHHFHGLLQLLTVRRVAIERIAVSLCLHLSSPQTLALPTRDKTCERLSDRDDVHKDPDRGEGLG